MAEPTLEELAAFQHALLELLVQDLPSDQLQARLRSGDAFRPFQEYVSRFDPRMVEVAAQLVKKWGRRANRPGANLAPER